MAVYTDITDQELEAFLAEYDLGAPVAFKGIAEGVESSNFLLETETGRYILTVYERRARPEDLPYFLDLLGWLADRGYPSARPVGDKAGKTLPEDVELEELWGALRAVYPVSITPEELIEAADQALYQAKRDGGNCLRWVDDPDGP